MGKEVIIYSRWNLGQETENVAKLWENVNALKAS